MVKNSASKKAHENGKIQNLPTCTTLPTSTDEKCQKLKSKCQHCKVQVYFNSKFTEEEFMHEHFYLQKCPHCNDINLKKIKMIYHIANDHHQYCCMTCEQFFKNQQDAQQHKCQKKLEYYQCSILTKKPHKRQDCDCDQCKQYEQCRIRMYNSQIDLFQHYQRFHKLRVDDIFEQTNLQCQSIKFNQNLPQIEEFPEDDYFGYLGQNEFEILDYYRDTHKTKNWQIHYQLKKENLINNKNICNMNATLKQFEGIEEFFKKHPYFKSREKRTFANFPDFKNLQRNQKILKHKKISGKKGVVNKKFFSNI